MTKPSFIDLIELWVKQKYGVTTERPHHGFPNSYVSFGEMLWTVTVWDDGNIRGTAWQDLLTIKSSVDLIVSPADPQMFVELEKIVDSVRP